MRQHDSYSVFLGWISFETVVIETEIQSLEVFLPVVRHIFASNPPTSKSDQVQISPAASPVIITSHGIENLAFHSLLRWKMTLPILTTSPTHFSLKGWENVLFERGSERANSGFLPAPMRQMMQLKRSAGLILDAGCRMINLHVSLLCVASRNAANEFETVKGKK